MLFLLTTPLVAALAFAVGVLVGHRRFGGVS